MQIKRARERIVMSPVSYTHLDVYKRQLFFSSVNRQKEMLCVMVRWQVLTELFMKVLSRKNLLLSDLTRTG